MKTKNKIISSIAALSTLLLPVIGNATTYNQDKQAVQQKAREAFKILVLEQKKGYIQYADQNCEGQAKDKFTLLNGIPGTESLTDSILQDIVSGAADPTNQNATETITKESYTKIDSTHWSAFLKGKKNVKGRDGQSVDYISQAHMKLHKTGQNTWKIYEIQYPKAQVQYNK